MYIIILPVAMYPASNLSGEKLYPIAFSVLEALKLHGYSCLNHKWRQTAQNRNSTVFGVSIQHHH